MRIWGGVSWGWPVCLGASQLVFCKDSEPADSTSPVSHWEQ